MMLRYSFDLDKEADAVEAAVLPALAQGQAVVLVAGLAVGGDEQVVLP